MAIYIDETLDKRGSSLEKGYLGKLFTFSCSSHQEKSLQ